MNVTRSSVIYIVQAHDSMAQTAQNVLQNLTKTSSCISLYMDNCSVNWNTPLIDNACLCGQMFTGDMSAGPILQAVSEVHAHLKFGLMWPTSESSSMKSPHPSDF